MKDQKMTDDELAAQLGSRILSAINSPDGDISQARKESNDYYLGKPYGNERDGYSSYTTREVLEAVEWAKPAIIRVFTAGDKVVSFSPVNPGDEDQADQDTDAINHMILKENDGYEAIYQWITDALLYPNGYVKLWCDDTDETTTERYENLTENELTALLDDEEVDIVEQDEYPAVLPHPENGEPTALTLYSVKIRRTVTKKKLQFEAVPPEQVLVGNDCLSQDLDSADFVCHRVKRAYTDLVNDGFDRDLLEDVAQGDGNDWGDEKTAREFYEDEDEEGDEGDDSMRKYWVDECYVRVDYDGDGLAERRKVVLIGNTVFENEELDYQPFVSLSSILLSHKHTGLALADLVKPIQKVASTLYRQLLDNIYRLNIRRKYVGEGALIEDGTTIEALTDTASEIIPCRDPNMIREEVVQPIIGDILPAIQGMTDQAQMRTGITPNLSLDPNVLQQSTMGAFSAALEQASERIELITRTFAETGFKRLMRKAHRLSREYMDHELHFKLGDQWVEVNPSDWRERTNVTVNVGLGFNDKATKIQLLAQLLEYQKEALGIGMATPDNVYNTMTEMVEMAGLGDVSRYFTDPATIEPKPPQPDPQMELVTQQLNNEAQKIQLEGQKAQAASQEAAAKFQADVEKFKEEIGFKREQLELEREKLRYTQHQKDQDIETKLIDIQARIEEKEAGKNVKAELSELDQAALDTLRSLSS